jgi:protein-tyrosine phosphatase
MSKYKTITKATCHHSGEEVILKINGVSVYGASVYKLVPVSGDVLLNCTDSERDEPEDQAFPEGYESLSEHVSQFTVINLNWPDGDAPDVAPAFWRDLPRLVKRNGGVSLVPYCLGSHGRTGTALASMAIIHKRLSAFEAVKLIREKHCHRAVETAAQCDYLHRVEVWAIEQGIAIKPDGQRPQASYSLFATAQPKKLPLALPVEIDEPDGYAPFNFNISES